MKRASGFPKYRHVPIMIFLRMPILEDGDNLEYKNHQATSPHLLKDQDILLP